MVIGDIFFRTFFEQPKVQEKKQIAVIVDGPNMLQQGGIDLKQIMDTAKTYGVVRLAKVMLNQFSSEKLIEAVSNNGFEPVLSVGDVDVALTVDFMEILFNLEITHVILATRDADFVPAIMRAKAYKKRIILFTKKDAVVGRALLNAADEVVYL